MFKPIRLLAVAVLLVLAVVAPRAIRKMQERDTARRGFHGNPHAKALAFNEGGEEENRADLARARYEDKAYPSEFVDAAMREESARAHSALSSFRTSRRSSWKSLGPRRPFVPGDVTYTGVPTVVSGRITALALSPRCDRDREERSDCRILVATAGGGVWTADDAFATRPEWRFASGSIPTNAIGSILFDPSDPSGRTIYVGTGEGNQSADSEAGLGLFRSRDGGRSWTLVEGSKAVASNGAIAAIAVDPKDSRHIFIGTIDAVIAGTAVAGGYTYPIPGAPVPGLYESLDDGKSFSLVLDVAVSELALDPADPATVYAATFGWGVFRRSARLDGDSTFRLVLDAWDRTSLAVTSKDGHTRIYVGRGYSEQIPNADLLRADGAEQLNAAGLAAAWVELSSAEPGTAGFSSYAFCGGQCWYDMFVATPPGRPDEVWIGGAMQYDEIFTANQPSNGRAVQRSTDAGASFTDMTNDAQNLGMHPDQHAIVFAGGTAFIGSDGGLVRTSGKYVDASAQCNSRGLETLKDDPTALARCKAWLSSIPSRIYSLNDGLDTLQFQSVSINSHDPREIMGGTQDNGTWSFNGKSWFESVGGDGGQSGFDVGNPNIRMHTYYGAQGDVNFRGSDPLGWNWIFTPLRRANANGEAFSFYIPLINDPKVSGTWFAAGQRVWRTQDNGGDQAFLEKHCNEYTGDFPANVTCGDWVRLGALASQPPSVPLLTGNYYGSDKTGSYIVALARGSSDANTLWVATRRGRVFVSTNAAAPEREVVFHRIDTPAQPRRFVSGIAVDPADPFHAFISFSGYSVTTPNQPGHVFDVHYSASGTTWQDISLNVGDQPITALVYDDRAGDLFAATEFGVAEMHVSASKRSWRFAAPNLPSAAVYGLAIDPKGRLLYAATHGRGAWVLDLSEAEEDVD